VTIACLYRLVNSLTANSHSKRNKVCRLIATFSYGSSKYFHTDYTTLYRIVSNCTCGVACAKLQRHLEDPEPNEGLQKYSHSLCSFPIFVDIDPNTWNQLRNYVMEWHPAIEEAKTRAYVDLSKYR